MIALSFIVLNQITGYNSGERSEINMDFVAHTGSLVGLGCGIMAVAFPHRMSADMLQRIAFVAYGTISLCVPYSIQKLTKQDNLLAGAATVVLASGIASAVTASVLGAQLAKASISTMMKVTICASLYLISAAHAAIGWGVASGRLK